MGADIEIMNIKGATTDRMVQVCAAIDERFTFDFNGVSAL
jgi:hypothetical protein